MKLYIFYSNQAAILNDNIDATTFLLENVVNMSDVQSILDDPYIMTPQFTTQKMRDLLLQTKSDETNKRIPAMTPPLALSKDEKLGSDKENIDTQPIENVKPKKGGA